MLETKNLSYYIKEKPILTGITKSFQAGRIYAIMGQNGAGKTTFLKLLAGLIPATSGTISWQDKPYLTLPRTHIAQIIALLPQNPAIPFDFNVSELVLMGAYASKKQNDLQEVLEQIDLWHLRHRLVHTLSGGERQRCYIARALMAATPIILLDEPTSHLDNSSKLTVWKLLQELAHNHGKLIIASSHDLDCTKQFCDHLYIIDNKNSAR